MSRYGLLLGVLVVVSFGIPGYAADKPAADKPAEEQPAAMKAGLTEATLKKWMDKQYTDMGQYATKKETLEYSSIRYGEPREGHPLSDGVPDNKKTTVYPIKLSFIHTTTYTNSNVTKKESVVCSIVAFKDDFGDWTWRLKENTVEAVK